MRKQYKNKRDFYKSQMEQYKSSNNMLLEEINKLRKLKTEPTKKITVKWFCTQCRVGGQGAVSAGINIESCSCPSCGANKLLAAAKFPFDIC